MSERLPTSRAGASRHLLADDARCASFSHNVRGLPSNRPGPECGGPTGQGAKPVPLASCDGLWLRRIRLGIILAIAGVFFEITRRVLIDGLDLLAGQPAILVAIPIVLGAALGLWALLLITAREPRIPPAEDPVILRKVTRACAVASFAGAILQESQPFIARALVISIGAAALGIAGVTGQFGLFVYLRRFARRIPNPKLARSTTAVMWGFVIAYALLALTGLAAVLLAAPTTLFGAATAVSVSEKLVAIVGLVGSISLLIFGTAYIVLLILYVSGLTRACHQAIRHARASLPATPPGTLFAHRLVPPVPGEMPSSPRKTILSPVPSRPPVRASAKAGTARLADLTAALWREPNSPKAHFDLAVMLAGQGRIREAVQQYEEAVRLKEDFVEARMNLANCLARQHRLREAVEQLETVVRLAPSSAAAHYNLGNLLLRDGEADAAIRCYREAVALRAGFAGAHHNLGIALLRAGDPDGAAEQFRAVLQINPADPRAKEKLSAAMMPM